VAYKNHTAQVSSVAKAVLPIKHDKPPLIYCSPWLVQKRLCPFAQADSSYGILDLPRGAVVALVSQLGCCASANAPSYRRTFFIVLLNLKCDKIGDTLA
jgi:hypothetical protein